MIYEEIFTEFDLRSVRYLVVGGMAVNRNPVDFEEAYSKREVMTIAGAKVSIVSIDDLIKMKALTGRPRDKEDVHHLERIKALKGK